MDKIPSVDYRWNDCYWITDFVTPGNPDLEDIVAGLGNSNGDKFIDKVAFFVRDNFIYPMFGKNPSSDGQFLRYHKSLWSYAFRRCVFYMWNFPAETLLISQGICIDTANLATSLLLVKASALVCLGEVRKTSDDTLLGLHAWTKLLYKGGLNVMETTIHEPGINTLVNVYSAYDKESDWAKAGGIYYVEQAAYNNKEFTGDVDIVAKMGLPASRVLLFGVERTYAMSRKKLYKEWRMEEKMKESLLKVAYGVKE